MTTDLTADPGETIRSEGRTRQSVPLPRLSVDLRRSLTVGVEPGADLEVRGIIGEGGMGQVLLARQHSLSRDVAVKTVKPDATENARNALLVEGAITGQLEHPAIVPVHALGLDAAGWPALVMKRVEGVAWSVLLDDPDHPGWEGWEGATVNRLPGNLQILESVCNALHFAHSRGIVHRDVKPDNVLIGSFGDVYLADWGVAGEVGSIASGVCGTPAFLAPEMVTGGAVDARTDVYLLGATLHLILTGTLRHPGSTITEALEHARLSAPATYDQTSVPAELAALANQACHPDPTQRLPSARAFRDALKQFNRHRQAVALAEQAARRLTEFESLLTIPVHDLAQRERSERLLAEARFGLEQSLTEWAENASARAALTRVEAILDARRRATLTLEAESRDRDPQRGTLGRTLGLLGMTLLGSVVAILANSGAVAPTPVALVAFPTVMIFLIGVSTWVWGYKTLETALNRQALGGLFACLGLIVLGRGFGLVSDTPISLSTHFARDAFVLSAGSAVLGIAYFRWVAVVSVGFAIIGLLCMALPNQAIVLFSWAAVAAMAFGTWTSWRSGPSRSP